MTTRCDRQHFDGDDGAEQDFRDKSAASSSSVTLTCAEVRRVTKTTRVGDLRAFESMPATKSFGSLHCAPFAATGAG